MFLQGLNLQIESIAVRPAPPFSIKDLLKINLRVHEVWSILAQVNAIKNEILKSLLKLCLPYQYSPLQIGS